MSFLFSNLTFEKKYLFWFAENGAAAPGAGQMSYLWKVKLEKRNDIFWLRDKETNSIQTNKEEGLVEVAGCEKILKLILLQVPFGNSPLEFFKKCWF